MKYLQHYHAKKPSVKLTFGLCWIRHESTSSLFFFAFHVLLNSCSLSSKWASLQLFLKCSHFSTHTDITSQVCGVLHSTMGIFTVTVILPQADKETKVQRSPRPENRHLLPHCSKNPNIPRRAQNAIVTVAIW